MDLLTAGADPFSTAAADVVRNLYDGVDTTTANPTFTHYSVDLTGVLTPGQTYQLRFAVANNLFVLNQGIDNVSLTAVPEPAAGLLLLSGSALLALADRRRRRPAGRARP